MKNTNTKKEIIFFSEMFFSCKAYCSGCNINKDFSKEVIYNNEEIKIINNKIIEYTKYMTETNKEEFYSSLTIGPADFLSLPYEKIIEILDRFDKSIKLIVAGNLSLDDEKNKIKLLKEYSIKNNKDILLQIVFNPIMKEEHKHILKDNIKYIIEEFGQFDTVLNMSESIYETLTPEQYLEILKEMNINYVAIVSSPNDMLINKKMFNTSLEKETKWLSELLDIWYDNKNYEHIELEVFENRAIFFKSFDLNSTDIKYFNEVVKNHYSKILYIDKHLDLRMSCENIGDYHYIEESGFKPLGNLKNKSISEILNDIEFKKLMNKQISGILTDKVCSECKFKVYCMTTPVFWQKQKYIQVKGKEENELCYGFKQINNKIIESFK
jgi:hypothetical protein